MPPQLNTSNLLKTSVLALSLVLTACATAPNTSSAKLHFKQGNYQMAEIELKKKLKPTGKNALLYFMEVGTVQHLQGNFEKSNHSLTQAERIVEANYTQSVSGAIGGAILSGAQSKFQGAEYEHVMINYYKALNYIGLAQKKTSQRYDYLDKANVEIRRLNNRLKVMQEKHGDYPDESNSGGIKGMFATVFGEKIDRSKLLYRNDAFAQYVSGLIFELNKELDDARVSFEQAAKTYESGFSAQYQLGEGITELAWFDAIRIMKNDGGYNDRWPNYVEKLNHKKTQIDNISRNQPELTIVQHLGMTPEKGQLNLILTAQEWNQSLVLIPAFSGTAAEQQAQAAWFEMLYADTDFFSVMQNFATGGFSGVVIGQFTKVYPLGPLWYEAVNSDLVNAINYLGGVRIAVPYYKGDTTQFGNTEVWVNDKKVDQLLTASSIQKIAYQEQVRKANRQIQAAVIEESLKAIASYKAQKEVENQTEDAFVGLLAGLAFKGLQTAAASTDTRHWQSLPAEIRVARIPLQQGRNQVDVITYPKFGAPIKQRYIVNSEKGNQIWKLRTLDTTREHVVFAPNARPKAAASSASGAVSVAASNPDTPRSDSTTPPIPASSAPSLPSSVAPSPSSAPAIPASDISTPAVSGPSISAPSIPEPAISEPGMSAPTMSAPSMSAP